MSTSQDRREYPPEGSDKNRSVSFGYTPTEQERQVFSEAGRRMIMLHVGGILVGCISGVVGGRRLGIPFRSIRGMVFVAGGVVLGEMTGRRLGDHQSGKILQAGLASNSTLRMMLESSDIGFSLLNLYRANTIKPKLDASGEFGFHITTPSPLLVEQILLQQQAEDATNRTLSVLETTTESGASTNSGDVAASTWDKIRRQHDHSVMTTWDRLRMQNNGRGPAASQALQTADTPQNNKLDAFGEFDKMDDLLGPKVVIPLGTARHDPKIQLPRTREEVEAAQAERSPRKNQYGDLVE